MADGHEADGARLAVDGIDDPKPADAKLPHSRKLTEERLSTFWVCGDGTDRRLDRPFQVRVERTDDINNVGRDIRTERLHADRRFFVGAIGSPKTSSNDRPFLPDL